MICKLVKHYHSNLQIKYNVIYKGRVGDTTLELELPDAQMEDRYVCKY